MKSKFSLLCVLTLFIGSSAPAQSPPSVSSVLDAQRQVKNYSSAVISPDGSRVAWVEGLEGGGSSRRLSAVWTASVAGGKPVRVTAASDGKNRREAGVAWSPDSQRLAFLSDAAREGQLEIYVAPASGYPIRQITRVIGQLSHLGWSPDGKSIAFLFVEGSTQEPGALVPYKLDSGVVEETFEEQRIAIVDVATGRVRTISPADLYIYEYDWSPGGSHFAATGAHGSGTNN
ncbi:MAG TPA: S9 family peptidase, partial [Thermoanaerobaculia bacterium]|nr:S9 family peptidase [Thermoanaerobaculia bacterium]